MSTKATVLPDDVLIKDLTARGLTGNKGKTLDEVVPVHVAEVVNHGEQLIIPNGMTAADAIRLLLRRMDYENEKTEIISTFDCFPWDGAWALFNVLKRLYGWVSMESVYSFFGTERPKIREIEVGVREVAAVPWGRITLFKNEGFIETGVDKKGDRFVFKATATILRKHERTVRDIYGEVRMELHRNSIYRGKAVAVRFLNEDGDPLPVPEATFVDVEGATKDKLIFSQEVHDSIETNLFMPIERMKDIEAVGMPTKYGVLMCGVFGVGKTLAARVAAALAVENEVTFIYCKRADEFGQAIQFGTQYSPSVVFCEDIDRVLSGERNVKMDDILNIIDGVDTKNTKVIIVLTTNDPKSINPASIRPGRLDAIIDVKKPDAHAVERLIRLYGGSDLADNVNLQRVAIKLADQIPAVIEEVVKRSKRSALRRTRRGDTNIVISEEALGEAAATMKMQLDLLNPPPKQEMLTTFEQVMEPVVAKIKADIAEMLPHAIEKGVQKYVENN